MPFLVDTDVLIDVSRNNPAAIAYIDGLGGDWALSSMTALELVAGTRNQREVELIDRLIEAFDVIPVNEGIGRRAYELLRRHARADGLRAFDSLIAATALEEKRTLVSRNHKHFRLVAGLSLDVPVY